MDYFKKIIYEFGNLLQTLPTTFKHRLFLGFLFSEIDTPRFKEKFEQPIGMAGRSDWQTFVPKRPIESH